MFIFMQQICVSLSGENTGDFYKKIKIYVKF